MHCWEKLVLYFPLRSHSFVFLHFVYLDNRQYVQVNSIKSSYSHAGAFFAVFVATTKTVVVLFATTVLVPAGAVTVLVTTPPLCVVIWEKVCVATGRVVRTVDVVSADLVITIVCCAAVTVAVDVRVCMLLTVTAGGVMVCTCCLVM